MLSLMAQRATNHVQQHHSWAARADWLLNVLLSVMHGDHFNQTELIFGQNDVRAPRKTREKRVRGRHIQKVRGAKTKQPKVRW